MACNRKLFIDNGICLTLELCLSKLKAKIRALLADDHHIVREGIRQLLESAKDIEVVAEAGDGEEAQALIE